MQDVYTLWTLCGQLNVVTNIEPIPQHSSHSQISPSTSMSMELFLADGSDVCATFFRTEDDEPLYRTEISDDDKITFVKFPLGQGAKIDSEKYEGNLKHVSGYEMATITLHSSHPDVFEVYGEKFTNEDLLEKVGLPGWFGRDRLWTGPDGLEYRWQMHADRTELVLNEEDKTVVARFNEEHTGMFGFNEACPPSLEIFGEDLSEELIDWIVILYVYMEDHRLDVKEDQDEFSRANRKLARKFR